MLLYIIYVNYVIVVINPLNRIEFHSSWALAAGIFIYHYTDWFSKGSF